MSSPERPRPSADRRPAFLDVSRPALAALALALSSCVGSERSASPTSTQTIGYPQTDMATGGTPQSSGTDRPASTPPVVPPGPQKTPIASSFHNTMLGPYTQTTQAMLASLSAEDEMALNPDGSFRLPPPIKIPIIDISQSYLALTTRGTHEEPQPVDISVPW